MFCGCALSFGEEPNTRTCPVCLGHPGTLPVTNAEAVHFGLMIGLALGCEIAPRSIFHRKNYFYPDLPKGYQISQYDIPLARDGRLGDVRIHRVHLEEDAAKLVHAGASGRIHGAEASVVDFNRGGTPLVEIVTEPDLRSAAEAAEFGAPAAGHAAAHGRLRREHGGGLAADGRQRVDPPGGRGHARHQDRAEEHELVPLPRARDRGRDRAPGGDPARRRRGRAGDAPLRPAARARSPRCARRRRRTTTATSPSPTWCRWRPPRRCSSAPEPRCPSCRPRAPSASSASSACPPDTAKLLAFRDRAGRLLRGGARRTAADPRALANWVTDELVAAARRRRAGDSKVEPAALARAGGDGRREGRCRGAAAKRGARRAGRRGRRPARDRRGAGPGRWPARTSWREIVERAMADQADAVEKIRAGQRQGDRRDRRRRDARDEGPRRRRRGPAPDPRADRR